MNDKSMDYKNEVIISLNKYSNMVFRLAFARTKNNHDANDIMQEVFLRYMKNKKEFKDEEHKKAWLIKTTINCSKTLLTSAWPPVSNYRHHHNQYPSESSSSPAS